MIKYPNLVMMAKFKPWQLMLVFYISRIDFILKQDYEVVQRAGFTHLLRTVAEVDRVVDDIAICNDQQLDLENLRLILQQAKFEYESQLNSCHVALIGPLRYRVSQALQGLIDQIEQSYEAG